MCREAGPIPSAGRPCRPKGMRMERCESGTSQSNEPFFVLTLFLSSPPPYLQPLVSPSPFPVQAPFHLHTCFPSVG